MVKEILTRWPVVRQILTHTDGTGAEAMSDRTRNLASKHRNTQVARSVCPGSRSCDGYDRGAGLGIAQTYVRRKERRRTPDAHHRHRAPWRRYARQRRKLPDQEAVRCRTWNGVYQQSGPYLTLLDRARSGHIVRTRRRYDRTAGSDECRRYPDYGFEHDRKSPRRFPVGDRSAGARCKDHSRG